MIVIDYDQKIKIIADNELSYYVKHYDKVIILGKMNNNYPSIKKMCVTDRNIEGVISFFKKRIQDHQTKLKSYESQLTTFLNDCDEWGVFK